MFPHVRPLDFFPRFENQAAVVVFQQRRVGKHTPPSAGVFQTVHQSEAVADDVAQDCAASSLDLGLAVCVEALHQIGVFNRAAGVAVKQPVPFVHDHRVVIRLTSDHYAVNVLQVSGDCFVGGDAAVDDDFQLGKLLLEAVNVIVFQRRNVAVFFGGKPVQPCVAGVDDEGFAGGFVAQRADEIGDGLIFGLPVDADAVFDGNGDLDRVLHGVEAVGNQHDFVHQTRAERAFLYAWAGAAAIEVDLVVAVFFGGFGCFRQIGRVAAAQLQGDGLLTFVKHQKAVFVAIDDGARIDHFAVKPCVAGNLAGKIAVVVVCPVEHGGNGKAAEWEGGLSHVFHVSDYFQAALYQTDCVGNRHRGRLKRQNLLFEAGFLCSKAIIRRNLSAYLYMYKGMMRRQTMRRLRHCLKTRESC